MFNETIGILERHNLVTESKTKEEIDSQISDISSCFFHRPSDIIEFLSPSRYFSIYPSEFFYEEDDYEKVLSKAAVAAGSDWDLKNLKCHLDGDNSTTHFILNDSSFTFTHDFPGEPISEAFLSEFQKLLKSTDKGKFIELGGEDSVGYLYLPNDAARDLEQLGAFKVIIND